MDEFWKRFVQYVRSYLPDWQYQPGGPEPEGALMTVLGELLEDSRRRLKGLPEKHQREFLGAWEDAPQPREPMYVYAGFSAPQGTRLPGGSVFYCSGDGTRLWETVGDTWAEAGGLAEQVFSDGTWGKLVRLPPPARGGPVRLFDFRLPGFERRQVRFCHPTAFASQTGCEAALRLKGAGDGLPDFLSCPQTCAWYLETEGEPLPLDPPTAEGELLRFRLPAAAGAWALLASVTEGAVPPDLPVSRVLAQTSRAAGEETLVLTDDGLYQGGAWLPFGSRLMQWNTCYIDCPNVLCLPGAQVTLSWVQSEQTREELLPEMDRQPEYRPVMRRLPKTPPEIRQVRADLVAWEYWNGTVWRTIPGTEAWTGVFSGGAQACATPRAVRVSFRWPEDARPCPVRGVEGCWLRWRLSACEGAGWLPARYHAPEVSQLQVTAVLTGAGVALQRRWGAEEDFEALPEHRAKALFPAFSPGWDCWWLGFDSPPGGSTRTLYLALGERIAGGRLSAWEAAPDGGLRPLSLRDGTGGLAHSGVMALDGIAGYTALRFGKRRWWLCLREESGAFRGEGVRPVLVGLTCGAALLKAQGEDRCPTGAPFAPLHGGPVVGIALSDGFGGGPEEGEEEQLRRLQLERHNLGRIVSPADAEEMICGRVRDVARVRCVRSGDRLQVGVLMRDGARHEGAFQLKRARIEELLLTAGVLPALGLIPQVREPCFYPIHVMVWVRLPSGHGLDGVRGRIGQALDRFLDPVSGHFRGDGWQMGALPTPVQIRTCLQSAAPDLSLVELVVSAGTPEGREREPSAIHDPFALPLGGSYTVFSI